MLDACIVDEDVHAAEGLFPERDHLGDVPGLGHVRGRMDDLHPEVGLDCGSRLLDIGGRPHAVEHDVGPGAGKGPRTRQTYAACRTGHDCCLVSQDTRFVHRLLPSIYDQVTRLLSLARSGRRIGCCR